MSTTRPPQTTNMVKRAVVSLENADVGKRSVTQVKSLGGVAYNVETIYPYGIYAVAPLGSDVIVINVLGGEENKVGIPYDTLMRFKNLKPGEVIVGNPITQSYIKFSADGAIDIVGATDLNINVTGTVNVNASTVNLGGAGGAGVARIGDAVIETSPGVWEIQGGSSKVFSQ